MVNNNIVPYIEETQQYIWLGYYALYRTLPLNYSCADVEGMQYTLQTHTQKETSK